MAPLLLLLLGATAPAMPTAVRLEQRERARVEAADEILIYRTRAGDTLPGLADRWFVEPEDWRKAAALNRLADPRSIPAGTPLKLRAGWLRTSPIRAELVALRGDVRLLRGTAALAAVKGMELAEGDIVETGPNGYATLALPDSSKVSLPSASRIRLARLRMLPITDSIDRRFELERGRSDARVTPMANPASRFTITTPVAVAAVRGTAFSVTYTPAEMKALTSVSEGKVAVGPREGGGEVLLLEGFGNLATGRGSGQPVRLLAAPAMEAPEQIQDDEEVIFRVGPAPGATRYLVEIAADQAFDDRLGSIEVEGEVAAFRDVPNGSLFVRAAAVDADGLIGLPTDPVEFTRDWAGNRTAEKPDKDAARDRLAQLGLAGAGGFDWFQGAGGGPAFAAQDIAEGDASYDDAAFGTEDPIPPLPEDFTPPPAGGGSGTGPGGGGGGGAGGGFGGGLGGGGSPGGGSPSSGGGSPESSGGPGPVGPGSGSGSGPGDSESVETGGGGPSIIIPDPVLPAVPPALPAPDFGGGTTAPPGGGVRPDAPAIPEPATWALLISGFALVGHALRRRRRRARG